MAVRVEKRIARARSFFSTERLTMLTPTSSLRRVRVIPRASSSSSRRQCIPVSSSSMVTVLPVRVGASDESLCFALHPLSGAESDGHGSQRDARERGDPIGGGDGGDRFNRAVSERGERSICAQG